MIQLPHDTIRITVFASRYDMYCDAFLIGITWIYEIRRSKYSIINNFVMLDVFMFYTLPQFISISCIYNQSVYIKISWILRSQKPESGPTLFQYRIYQELSMETGLLN